MLIMITCGSCLFGGHIYILDSLVGVIHLLVFPVCWDDEMYEGRLVIDWLLAQGAPPDICRQNSESQEMGEGVMDRIPL